MKDLYKKVLRGNFPKISSNYSVGLSRTVNRLIQVQPKARPSADTLLDSDSILEKLAQIFPEEFKETQTALLNTIRVPMNLHYLTERLPKPDYEHGGASASITAATFRGRGLEDVYQNLP